MAIDEAVPRLRSLWPETTGDPRICVAVLDGPVDGSHPCFSAARLTPIETIATAAAGNDPATRHGTHVASVIFGRHGSSVPGVAPGCRGLIVPIYSPRQGDVRFCTQLDLARAINLAVIHGAHIINVSGGEFAPGAEAEPLLAQAIRRCSESGVLIVAAAGNNGCACVHVPAAVPSVLAVGAMNAAGMPLEFSNWGEAYLEQGILAPGENILGAVPGGGVAYRTGTSFAAAVVSGIAALLMSVQLARGEKPDAKRVRAAILAGARPCEPGVGTDCRRLLAGRLSLGAAYALLAAERKGAAAEADSSSGVKAPADATLVTWRGSAYPAASPAEGLQASGASETTTDVIPAHPTIGPGVAIHINHQPTKRGGHMSSQEFIETAPADAANMIPSIAVATEDIAGRPDIDSGAQEATAAAVLPSAIEAACSCESGESAGPALAYVLGQIGYDFGTESRRDQFLQLTKRNVHDPRELLAYLEKDPASAASVFWTLSLDTTVVYAVVPYGPFASVAYERLRKALGAQLTEGAERVSVPGLVKGSVRLLNGQTVPVLYPDVRGLYSWHTPALIKATVGEAPKGDAAAAHAQKAEGIRNFLERVYYEVRNLGITPQERSMNYAATNAFQLEFIYKDAVLNGLKLDNIGVERSPICRPGSDCWDVKLIFFNPARRLDQARHVYRFTVDVSEVIPVTVGAVRHWDVY